MAKSRLTASDLGMILAKLVLNQEEFAAIFNVDQATVSRWLNGQIGVPGYVEAWLREAHPEILAEHIGDLRNE